MAGLRRIGIDRLAARQPAALEVLLEACTDTGAFLLSGVAMDGGTAPLTLARRFFVLDRDARRRLDIAGSRHFRGYSVMHTERDWREQFHFGRERAAAPVRQPWDRLEGPNLWPDDADLRAGTLALMQRAEDVGDVLLGALAAALSLPPGTLSCTADGAYTLMKFIRYHVQPEDGAARSGVAAHCDFSWLTLLFQDSVSGLQVMDRSGRWIDVPATPDLVAVNVGELLQFLTWGALFAAPHRVVNRSCAQERLSIPVFINPPLACAVPRTAARGGEPAWPDTGHVHRVLPWSHIVDAGVQELHFGHAEWRRKGENIWCAQCCAA